MSTIGQTLDTQMKILETHGCEKIFCEKVSGADAQREQLRKMVRSLKKDDVVIVARIDRLARSTFDLFSIVQNITKKGAHFYSLSEPWVDTNTSTGRLMLAVLAGLADVERDLIRTRTAEGRARAIELGKRMGRPSKMTQLEKQEIVRRRLGGDSLRVLAQDFGISVSTVSRLTLERTRFSV
ncbi:DNA resolvase [Acetobacter orleanensis NRIC 0473]|uniref:DNA invertase n=1 Tax=Acetobacter orleanensis TaxID=104099 RepID=A0A4Y3TPK5_9PROT|nr:DNA recombinase/resolvase [Acetobacter orleanensis JCM 7639]GBR22639.1 DNA resolvase [Acetobacter orleanensis NRIC 0473]GEB82745.1 DNA invertase [Acetobacter orleanensis]